MKYILTTMMSIVILMFAGCGDDAEDTAVSEDSAVVETDAGSDASESVSEADSEPVEARDDVSDADDNADDGEGDSNE